MERFICENLQFTGASACECGLQERGHCMNNCPKESENPFFSILIPSYDRPEFLEKCLSSIFKSKFRDFEVIVSDDHSPKIVEIERVVSLFSRYEQLRFVKQERNLGMANNWNCLASLARGNYLIIVGDDDMIFPTTLARLKYYIEIFPEYSLYGLGYSVIDENDAFCYSRFAPFTFEVSLLFPKFVRHILESGILPFWTFHPFTICYRREISEKVHYNAKASIGSDLLFLFDCINLDMRLLALPEILFLWRKNQFDNKHYKNLSSYSGSNSIARAKILDILEERKDLKPAIVQIIKRYSFRKRFLYDAVLLDKHFAGQRLLDLGLGKKHLEELVDWLGQGNDWINRIFVRLYQLGSFIKLFKSRGLFFILMYVNYFVKRKLSLLLRE